MSSPITHWTTCITDNVVTHYVHSTTCITDDFVTHYTFISQPPASLMMLSPITHSTICIINVITHYTLNHPYRQWCHFWIFSILNIQYNNTTYSPLTTSFSTLLVPQKVRLLAAAKQQPWADDTCYVLHDKWTFVAFQQDTHMTFTWQVDLHCITTGHAYDTYKRNGSSKEENNMTSTWQMDIHMTNGHPHLKVTFTWEADECKESDIQTSGHLPLDWSDEPHSKWSSLHNERTYTAQQN